MNYKTMQRVILVTQRNQHLNQKRFESIYNYVNQFDSDYSDNFGLRSLDIQEGAIFSLNEYRGEIYGSANPKRDMNQLKELDSKGYKIAYMDDNANLVPVTKERMESFLSRVYEEIRQSEEEYILQGY